MTQTVGLTSLGNTFYFGDAGVDVRREKYNLFHSQPRLGLATIALERSGSVWSKAFLNISQCFKTRFGGSWIAF